MVITQNYSFFSELYVSFITPIMLYWYFDVYLQVNH